MTNETFGITFQYAICDYYNLINDISEKRINHQLALQFKQSKIYHQIFKDNNPIEYLPQTKQFTSAFIQRCPHTFMLDNGETFSVRTFKEKGKMFAPKVVGQAGDDTFNHFFGHLGTDTIRRDNFKQFCFNNIQEILPIVIDYALVSDINCWVYFENNKLTYKIIKREDLPELTFQKHHFTFTKPTISSWIESNTVKYKGRSILELQLHTNRTGYKIRLHKDNFPELLKVEKAINNSVLGDTAELAICNVFQLNSEQHYQRLSNNSDKLILTEFENHYRSKKNELFPFKPTKYAGLDKRDRGGQSKSGVDFYLENDKTLSLKTNKSKSFKVCPPEIGQPSPRTFDLYFSQKGWYRGEMNEMKFRELVKNREVLADLLLEYVNYLNECDYLLWTSYLGNQEINSTVVEQQILTKINFNPDLIGYTNEFTSHSSVTIKYGPRNLPLGEFQVHSARNSLKFRFNLNNLLALARQKNTFAQ
jgi:hypothetical protein